MFLHKFNEIFRVNWTWISDCILKTLPVSQDSKEYAQCKRGEFVHNNTKPLFRIAWHFWTNTKYSGCRVSRHVDNFTYLHVISHCLPGIKPVIVIPLTTPKLKLSCRSILSLPWHDSTCHTNLCIAKMTEPDGHFVYWKSILSPGSHPTENRTCRKDLWAAFVLWGVFNWWKENSYKINKMHVHSKWRFSLLGCLCGPVVNSAFGRWCRKVVSRGRDDTRVWYRETMFSQMVLYYFLLHEPLHGYFLYLVSAPPEKPTRRCEPEEGYLRCLKRFDHRSHSIIFLLFEFKSVRWCCRWETLRNVAYKPTRRSR